MDTTSVKNVLGKIIQILVRIETILVISILGVMVIINTAAIFLRAVFGMSFLWINTLTLLLFSWLTFIGASLIFYHKEYISVAYFVDRLFHRHKRGLELIVNIFVMLFLVFIISQMPGLIKMQFHKLEFLPLPSFFLTLPILVGAITIFLVYILRTWNTDPAPEQTD